MFDKKKDTTILDSSINTGHKINFVPSISAYKNYNIKVIDCKDYVQVYLFDRLKNHLISGFEKENKFDIDIDDLINKNNYKKEKTIIEEQKILYNNVRRSKLKLQRIAKANEQDFKTFITLTFKDNITDLSYAYNKFRYFIKSIQRHKKVFKWLCVPEFQKNGRVHYHLITNLDLEEDKTLFYTQNLDNGELSYHLKHWSKGLDDNNMPIGKGFDCIELIKDKNGNDTKKLCGYISKYMTKAYIEDCFFNKNRYYLSQNLNLPIINYINNNDSFDNSYFNNLISNTDLIYQNEYNDTFGNEILFLEFKKK